MSINIFITSFVAFWVILGLVWFIAKWIKTNIINRDKYLTVIPIASASYQNIWNGFYNVSQDYLFIIFVLFFVLALGLVVWNWFRPPPVDN